MFHGMLGKFILKQTESSCAIFKHYCDCLIPVLYLIVGYYHFYTTYLFSLWQINVCFENIFLVFFCKGDTWNYKTRKPLSARIEQIWVESLSESINNYCKSLKSIMGYL